MLHVLSYRYGIERKIGSGGMATECLADDLEHDRQVGITVQYAMDVPLGPMFSRGTPRPRFATSTFGPSGTHFFDAHPESLPHHASDPRGEHRREGSHRAAAARRAGVDGDAATATAR